MCEAQTSDLNPQPHLLVGLFQLPVLHLLSPRLLHVSLHPPDVVHTRLQYGPLVLPEVPGRDGGEKKREREGRGERERGGEGEEGRERGGEREREEGRERGEGREKEGAVDGLGVKVITHVSVVGRSMPSSLIRSLMLNLRRRSTEWEGDWHETPATTGEAILVGGAGGGAYSCCGCSSSAAPSPPPSCP